MSDFNRQIRTRKEHDALHLSKAVSDLASAVNRRETVGGMQADREENIALYELCRYFGLPDSELPSDIVDIEEKLNYLLQDRGVMRRRVTLEGKWWKETAGPVLCTLKGNGHIVALFQDRFGRYCYREGEEKNRVRRVSSRGS